MLHLCAQRGVQDAQRITLRTLNSAAELRSTARDRRQTIAMRAGGAVVITTIIIIILSMMHN